MTIDTCFPLTLGVRAPSVERVAQYLPVGVTPEHVAFAAEAVIHASKVLVLNAAYWSAENVIVHSKCGGWRYRRHVGRPGRVEVFEDLLRRRVNSVRADHIQHAVALELCASGGIEDRWKAGLRKISIQHCERRYSGRRWTVDARMEP